MIDIEFNTSENIIFKLGRAGMTTSYPVKLSTILDVLEDSFGSKTRAKDNFNNTFKRTEYFIKTEGLGEYLFSSEGFNEYKQLDRNVSEVERADEATTDFFNNFLVDHIDKMVSSFSPVLEIPFDLIAKGMGPDFVELLESNPEETISELNKALKEQDTVQAIEYETSPVIEITGLSTVHQIEDVRKSSNLGKLVEIEGRVSLQTQTKPRAITAAFECLRCQEIQYIKQVPGGALIDPRECENEVCGRKGPFKLLGQPETVFVDSQIITMDSPKGQLQITVALMENQCEPPWVRDGKIVRVVGVLTHTALYTRNGRRSDFEYILLANSIRFADSSLVAPPTDEEIELFEKWVMDPIDLRQRIIGSVAPHIHGYEIEKNALSLSLFSDWAWTKDPEDVVVRSSIHTLLLGDPGIAKSQLMKDVLFLAPKSKYAQIVGSTPGGLANSAIQLNGEWFIKAGLFSHADQGIMGLDEIDKFRNKEDINCMINILEEQLQVVSKAGLTEVRFNGRTAVTATANPKRGNLNRFDPIMEQTDLPLYIMQRFDLVFIMFDIPEKGHDAKVAKAIYEQHRDPTKSRSEIKREIDTDLLRKYILYARTKPAPEIPESIEKVLSEYYLKIRSKKKDSDDPLISARSLNNLYRIARATARRELSPVVTDEHAQYAISLIRSSIQSLALGVEDHSVLKYGSSKSQRDKIQAVRDAIQTLCLKNDSATIDGIVFLKDLEIVEVEHIIQNLKRNGSIMRVGAGYRLIQ